MTDDPFGTRRLRDAVVAAWVAQPARFREDANAEEDNGRGYYRDRVVVELAQNAADAAVRAGVPGRLLLRLTDTGAGPATLFAANIGASLDDAGVASLSSLRASAKRDDGDGAGRTTGRFGVGFAAVRSVSDEVTVASASGAVHFSQLGTAALLGGAAPGLAAEVARRSGFLPALRLPFAGPGPVDLEAAGPGWDTVVALTLRDADAVDEARRQLAAVDDALLLALPALASIEVDDGGGSRVLQDVVSRWVRVTRSGTLPAHLLAERPVEERDRTGWQVTWAVPRRATAVAVPDVPDRPWHATVHAPTPTEEPCTLPALLVATFPLDPSRRHVAPGAVTDAVVAHAGATWGDLMVACRDEPLAPDPLDLLPPGLPAGALDAAIRRAALAATRDVPLLVPVCGGPPVTGPQAVVLTGPVGYDAEALRGLARWMADLVALAPRHRHLTGPLGITTTDLSEVVDALPHTTPAEHRELYEAFADVDATTLEQLATLSVPLADGRTVRGARGLVILDEVPADVTGILARWGIRAVHPDAAHRLLERLGATRADAGALARHPAVRERVLDDRDDDPDEVADVVLTLLLAAQEAGSTLAPEPWWAELLLPASDGDLVPARGLVVPGSAAADWYDPRILPQLDAEVARRWSDVLDAVGVRTGPTVLTVDVGGAGDDAELTTESLDGWEEYLDDLVDAGAQLDELGQVSVVADLDAVLPQRWPEVLRALSQGAPRRALTEPVRAGGTTLPSYAAWWLRRRSPLGLRRPFSIRPAAGATAPGRLSAVLGEAPTALDGLDGEVLRALGGVGDPRDLGPDGWADLVEALPAVGQSVPVPLAVELWQGLVVLAGRPGRGDLDGDRLPGLVAGGHVVMTPIDRLAVADPMWAQHPAAVPALVAPSDRTGQVADLLDVDLARGRAAGSVTSRGHQVPTPPAVLALFASAPVTWVEHDDLRVDDAQVGWWVDRGTVHAATTAGLARGLAALVGWTARASIERLLTDPGSLDEVALDLCGDTPPADQCGLGTGV